MLRLIHPILLLLLLTLVACGATGTGSPGTNSDVAVPPTLTVGAEAAPIEATVEPQLGVPVGSTVTAPAKVTGVAVTIVATPAPDTAVPAAPNIVATSTLAPMPPAGAATPTTVAQPAPQDLSNVVISLQRTRCYGMCPAYTVMIYGDGRVVYVGEEFVEVTGEQVRSIPVEQVRVLVEEFYRINFFGMQDLYEAPVTDIPSAITTLTVGDQTKSVINYGSAPEELTRLEQQIDLAAGTAEWIGLR